MTLSISVSDSITVKDSPNINSRLIKKFVMKIRRSLVFRTKIG